MPISHLELHSLSFLSSLSLSFSLSLIPPVTRNTHNIPSHSHTLLFLLFPTLDSPARTKKLTPHFLSLCANDLSLTFSARRSVPHRRYKGKLRQPPSPLFLSHPSCERGSTDPILHSISFFLLPFSRARVGRRQSSTKGDIGIDTGSFPDDQTFPSLVTQSIPTAIHSKTLLQGPFRTTFPSYISTVPVTYIALINLPFSYETRTTHPQPNV